MIALLLIGIGYGIAAVVAFIQRKWKRGLYKLAASAVLLGCVSYYLISWNAAMLKVQHDAATRAAG